MTAGTWATEDAATNDYTVSETNGKEIASTTADSIGESLLMIPQDMKGKTIEIAYDLVYTNPAQTISNTKAIVLDDKSNWVMNQQYTYTLTISLETVQLTASVGQFGANIDL